MSDENRDVMKQIVILFIAVLMSSCQCSAQQNKKEVEMKRLTAEEKYVIEDKGTERPYSGKYYDFKEAGNTPVKSVVLNSINQAINLIRVADGRRSTMRLRGQ